MQGAHDFLLALTVVLGVAAVTTVRSADAKRQLYAALVRNLERAPGIPPDRVLVVLNEPPLVDWGIRGGKPATDVQLGFRVDV